MSLHAPEKLGTFARKHWPEYQFDAAVKLGGKIRQSIHFVASVQMIVLKNLVDTKRFACSEFFVGWLRRKHCFEGR